MPTKIEWTEETWNPVTGCTKISAGCQHCYAERMAHRLAGRFGYPPAPDQFKVTLHPDRLDDPLHWNKPRKVFVCSMGDLFHENVDPEIIMQVIDVIVATPKHTYQILTKRPERMYRYLKQYFKHISKKVPTNLRLGVTAENQEAADERIPWLLKTTAAVRFVSVEPMLGPVLLDDGCNSWLTCHGPDPKEYGDECCESYAVYGEHFHGIDWVICGGETGPGARPMDWFWAESLHQQCLDADVPFFFKKPGDAFEDNPHLLPLSVRQWPKVVTHAE